jgi:hypothetical protein
LLGALAAGGLMAGLTLGAPASASAPHAASTGAEAAATATDDTSILCQGGGGSFTVPAQSSRDDQDTDCQAPGNTTIRYSWNVHFAGASACISVWGNNGWENTGCHSPGTSGWRDVPGWFSNWTTWIEGRNHNPSGTANIGWEWGP